MSYLIRMKLEEQATGAFAPDSSKLNWVLGILSISMFCYFAIPKLLGLGPSVKGFEQFSPVLGLDPTFFRLLTGSVELGTAVIILGSLVIASRRCILKNLGYLGTVGTMSGGLFVEFFARTKPAMPLVVIAIVFLLIALYQLRGLVGMILGKRETVAF